MKTVTSKKHAAMSGIDQQFESLKALYGLNTASQIKERIMWNNLQMVLRKLYDGPETVHTLQQLDGHWKIIEAIENDELKKGQ